MNRASTAQAMPVTHGVSRSWGLLLAFGVMGVPLLFSRESNIALPGVLGLHGAKGFVIASLLLLVLWMIRERPSLRLNAPMLVTVLFLVDATLSGFWAIDYDGFRAILPKFMYAALIAVVLYLTIRSRADLEHTVVAWKVVSVLVALSTSIEAFAPGWRLDGLDPSEVPECLLSGRDLAESDVGEYHRAAGPLGHSNWLGFFFGTTLLLQPYLWKRYPAARRWIAATTAVEIFALILAHVRLGLLGAAMGFLWVLLRGGLRYRLLPLMAAPLLAVIAFPLLPETFVKRVLDPDQYQSGESAEIRLDQTVQNLQLVRLYGGRGVGMGCFGAAYAAEASGLMAEVIADSRRLQTEPQWIGGHNTYLEVVIEQGIAGIVLFLGIPLLLAIGLLRAARTRTGDPSMVQLGRVLEGMLLSVVLMLGLLHVQEQRALWTFIGISSAYLALHKSGRLAPAAASG